MFADEAVKRREMAEEPHESGTTENEVDNRAKNTECVELGGDSTGRGR